MPLNFLDDYVVIDLETTGLRYERDEIIEIAAVKVVRGCIQDTFQVLVKPMSQITPYIESLTGITNEMVQSTGQSLKTALIRFIQFVGRSTLIGHNIQFDMHFLRRGFKEALNRKLFYRFQDTLHLSKRLIKRVPNHKLSTLATWFDIEMTQAHRALSDVMTTQQLYERLRLEQAESIPKQAEAMRLQIVEPGHDVSAVLAHLLPKNAVVFMPFPLVQLNEVVLEQLFAQCGYKVQFHWSDEVNVVMVSDEQLEIFIYPKNNAQFWFRILSKWKDELLAKIKAQAINLITESTFMEAAGLSPNACEYLLAHSDVYERLCEQLSGKVCVLTGQLLHLRRSDLIRLLQKVGAVVCDQVTQDTDILICGSYSSRGVRVQLPSKKYKRAEALKQRGQSIEILSEEVFYEWLGLV